MKGLRKLMLLGAVLGMLPAGTLRAQDQQPPAADPALIEQLLRALQGQQAPQPAAPPPPREDRLPDLFPEEAVLRLRTTTVTVSEADGQAVFLIDRSRNLDKPISFSYKVVSGQGQGAATLGQDVEAIDQVATIPAGQSILEVGIPLIDDNVFEGREEFRVVISNPRGAEIRGPAEVRVIVNEDDPRPTRKLEPGFVSVAPTTISFPATQVGRREFQTIRVTAGGEERVEVTGVEMTATGGLQVGRNACQGIVIQNGAHCDIRINFVPQGEVLGRGIVVVEAITIDVDGNRRPLPKQTVEVEGLGFEVIAFQDPQQAKLQAIQRHRLSDDSGLVINIERPEEKSVPPVQYRLQDEDYAALDLQKPFFTYPVDRSRVITEDRYIRCTLENRIVSQLAGDIICQVESNVYGSDGRYVLIPGGTRVKGRYESLQKQGDTRLAVVWNRFIRPDGSSFRVEDGYSGLDAGGSTGLPGFVDDRLAERFLTPVLLTFIAAASAFATPADDAQALAAQETFAEGLGAITLELLDEKLDLRPRISIPKGTRLVIMPKHDLWFKEPEVLTAVSAPAAVGRIEGATDSNPRVPPLPAN